jgi:predicted metal-dependent hydrolase
MDTEGAARESALERSREVRLALENYRRHFDRAEYFEAHEVLEELWLPVRRTSEGALWQGLIQLAAAFVHVQRSRPGPALSLLRSARQRLAGAEMEAPGVDRSQAIQLIAHWQAKLERALSQEVTQYLNQDPPRLGTR